MGMVFKDGAFGTTGPKMWLPGSTFEKELGMQAMTFKTSRPLGNGGHHGHGLQDRHLRHHGP